MPEVSQLAGIAAKEVGTVHRAGTASSLAPGKPRAIRTQHPLLQSSGSPRCTSEIHGHVYLRHMVLPVFPSRKAGCEQSSVTGAGLGLPGSLCWLPVSPRRQELLPSRSGSVLELCCCSRQRPLERGVLSKQVSVSGALPVRTRLSEPAWV